MNNKNITCSIVIFKPNIQQYNNLINLINNSIISKTLIIDHSPTPSVTQNLPPKFEYIHNPLNPGYGAGHNMAIRRVLNTSKYHFVLNPDIYFNPDDLKILIDYTENNPDVGQLMPKVIYPDGEVQYLCKLLPTPYDLLVRRFIPIKKIQDLNNTKFELRFSGYDKIMNVPYLSGCFMLLRVSALKEVGLFDERYFMYAEDIDLSRRIHQKYKTIFYPKVTIIHDHARSSYKNMKRFIIHIINIIKYFNKWGWFFDRERKKVNFQCINEIKLLKKDE